MPRSSYHIQFRLQVCCYSFFDDLLSLNFALILYQIEPKNQYRISTNLQNFDNYALQASNLQGVLSITKYPLHILSSLCRGCISLMDGYAFNQKDSVRCVIPLLQSIRAKTRANGAFYGNRLAESAEKSRVFMDSDR